MPTFDWPIRVYYEDTDVAGVVYYANYLKFFERARTEMLRAKGVEQDIVIREQNSLFVVRSVTVDYISPARFNDLIVVQSEISQLKKASLIFTQNICRESQKLCKATVTIACLNAETLRPKAIPLTLLAQFK
ncbi:MAG: tol-pal system-associated acyl-CoA thioesterase [Methylococcales bacterium]|nr:tol-pal system-associated acyl-CoA thioesterase [Methylococcales bacterium]MCK5924969.1 tol-pal system-associated acyl-CoA thioesterase [Methylococcales bacterium]